MKNRHVIKMQFKVLSMTEIFQLKHGNIYIYIYKQNLESRFDSLHPIYFYHFIEIPLPTSVAEQGF